MKNTSLKEKKKNIIILCLVIVIAFMAGALAFLIKDRGESNAPQDEKETVEEIAKDNDEYILITFEAQAENPTKEQLNAVKAVYETRLTGAGYTEAKVSVRKDNVDVKIPEADETDMDAVNELLSEVGRLTFRDEAGMVVLDGNDIKNAKSIYGQPNETSSPQYYIQVEFTSDAQAKFADATAAAVGGTIGIFVDENLVSAPTVNERIDNSTCIITGNFTAESAEKLANQINSGNLPFEMKKISQEIID